MWGQIEGPLVTDAITGSRIEVRRAGGAAYLFVPEVQIGTVGEVLRREAVAYELGAIQSNTVIVTLIGGDADARRAQDALDRVG